MPAITPDSIEIVQNGRVVEHEIYAPLTGEDWIDSLGDLSEIDAIEFDLSEFEFDFDWNFS